MRYSEQFMEHIEYAFNAFCKIVLRHEAVNAWRDLKRKEEREISLDYLMSERYFEPSAMDSYFEKQDKPTVFLVLGKEVIVDDERLATALSRLPELRREVLLLYYFVGYRDEAIGRLYGRCRSSINRRRNVAHNYSPNPPMSSGHGLSIPRTRQRPPSSEGASCPSTPGRYRQCPAGGR